MEEDADLKMIEQRKMEAMRRRLKTVPPPAKVGKSDREVVQGMLFDRGDEVLEAAYEFFPRETARVVGELADLIRSGRLKEPVGGGELLSIFRQLGLRFSLKTSIKIQDKGKLVDLSEKLSRKEE